MIAEDNPCFTPFCKAIASSIVLYFIVPAMYLVFRDQRFLKKALLFTLTSIPFTVIVDYFATRDGSWLNSTVFSFRILNGFALEDFLWVGAWFFYIVFFYEYFIDYPHRQSDIVINPRYKILLSVWFGALALFTLFYTWIDVHLYIPYTYLVFCILLGIFPLSILITQKTNFIYKFSLVAVYFFFVNILHVWSAFFAKQWVFPGKHFVGWVVLPKGFTFPVEELILFMILGSLFVTTYYEYFFDNVA